MQRVNEHCKCVCKNHSLKFNNNNSKEAKKKDGCYCHNCIINEQNVFFFFMATTTIKTTLFLTLRVKNFLKSKFTVSIGNSE